MALIGRRNGLELLVSGARNLLVGVIGAMTMAAVVTVIIGNPLTSPAFKSELNMVFALVSWAMLLGTLIAITFWSSWFMVGYLLMAYLMLIYGYLDLIEFGLTFIAAAAVLLKRFELNTLLSGGR